VARPRQHTDEQLLDLVAGALTRRTTLTRWTLAEVAAESGIAPATLVKRFGSRHSLLVALTRRWIDSIPVAVTATDPLQQLTTWVAGNSPPTRDRAAALVGMRLLMEDLSNDELAGLLVEGWTKQVEYLAALLARADLPLRDPRQCAELLFDALNGGVLRAAAGDTNSPDAQDTMRSLLELWR
jgi:AcrR family transcriptional regulator